MIWNPRSLLTPTGYKISNYKHMARWPTSDVYEVEGMRSLKVTEAKTGWDQDTSGEGECNGSVVFSGIPSAHSIQGGARHTQEKMSEQGRQWRWMQARPRLKGRLSTGISKDLTGVGLHQHSMPVLPNQKSPLETECLAIVLIFKW